MTQALEALLASAPYRESALQLDGLQGYCVALAMGPDATPPADWMAVALGVDGEVPPEHVQLLDTFAASTAGALDDGTLSISARDTRTGRVDYSGWCRGFLDGVEASATHWFDVADTEELDELLFPIEVLADALPAHERAAFTAARWRQLAHDAAQTLRDDVMRLRDYWRIVRAPPATLRREKAKVGRNDPCPCGSGRKFKQCHGR
jgi:uncharacterized protein